MRTSPGWIGSISSVVVNDLHLLWSGVCPSETDPSLVIDPDAVLTSSVALERLESVTGWDAEVFEHLRRSHLTKLAQCQPVTKLVGNNKDDGDHDKHDHIGQAEAAS